MPRQRASGLTQVELLVSIIVILLLSGLLLDRLLYYQEAAEKARLDLEIARLRLALQVRIGTLIAQRQVIKFGVLASENPISWLEAPMAGYRGELGPAQAQLLGGGSWYFDRQAAQLVYVVNNGRHLSVEGSDCKCIRFYVRTVRAQGNVTRGDSGTLGLQIAPVRPYRWM